MSVKQYDPKTVTIIVGGAIMQGYADDTFLTIARNEDMYALVVGCDGIGTRAKSNNKSGTYTFVLHQSSSSNAVLSAFAAADELSNTGVVPVLVREGGTGNTLSTALTAWVRKLPDVEYGKTVTNRTWVLETDSMDLAVGGN